MQGHVTREQDSLQSKSKSNHIYNISNQIEFAFNTVVYSTGKQMEHTEE